MLQSMSRPLPVSDTVPGAYSAERKSDVLAPRGPIDETGIDLGFGFLRDHSVHTRLSVFDSAHRDAFDHHPLRQQEQKDDGQH